MWEKTMGRFMHSKTGVPHSDPRSKSVSRYGKRNCEFDVWGTMRKMGHLLSFARSHPDCRSKNAVLISAVGGAAPRGGRGRFVGTKTLEWPNKGLRLNSWPGGIVVPMKKGMSERVAAVEISIIVPTLNEAGNLSALAGRIDVAMERTAYEIILVDDGSTDDTTGVCDRLRLRYPVRLVS